MNSTAPPRTPWAAAGAVAGVVLLGYIVTLAPSVTFWDAGELIAAARGLGIPHPPGTPVFVLLAHVWAQALPVGEYAWRTNLLSATASAAAAGFLFLVARETTRRLAAGLPAGSAGVRLYRPHCAGTGAAPALHGSRAGDAGPQRVRRLRVLLVLLPVRCLRRHVPDRTLEFTGRGLITLGPKW